MHPLILFHDPEKRQIMTTHYYIPHNNFSMAERRENNDRSADYVATEKGFVVDLKSALLNLQTLSRSYRSEP